MQGIGKGTVGQGLAQEIHPQDRDKGKGRIKLKLLNIDHLQQHIQKAMPGFSLRTKRIKFFKLVDY